jgi:hypothetical protein
LLIAWRFYNGRHHTTVLHAIDKSERLRATDESVDALIEIMTAALTCYIGHAPVDADRSPRSLLIEAVVSRVMDRLEELRASGDMHEADL